VITAELLADIYDVPERRVSGFIDPLNTVMNRFEITTKLRVAAFIAQIGHESGRFQFLQELWGPTDAQRRYEGRQDLGNTQRGDGYRYRGRGLIQLTGRNNYRTTGQALGLDLEGDPGLAALPENAALIAGHFWDSRNLNPLADAGDFTTITRCINGGTNGLADRRKIYEEALRLLPTEAAPAPPSSHRVYLNGLEITGKRIESNGVIVNAADPGKTHIKTEDV
jgi:putative chitinase